MNLIVFCIIVFILTIPFGYWRANVKRFGILWFLAIHVPIPFIILLRIFSGVGFEFITYPFTIAAFFTGHFIGKKIYSLRKERGLQPLSSCLVMDLFRVSK